MTEFLKILLNVRSLRVILRELPLEHITEAHEKFELIYQERLEQAEKEHAAQVVHMNKLTQFQAMLADAGIDPTELVGSAPTATATKRQRAPGQAKYRYVENGEESSWTGQGVPLSS